MAMVAAADQGGTPNRGLITLTVMISAVMVLIDMTIANVSLPHMMGALGATSDQITWVLTAYSMAEAIFIPMTSFFASKLGTRKLFIVSIIGFVLASMMCGQAQTIGEMVVFRIIQGAFGAFMIPLAQSTLVRVYSEQQRDKAMAIFSIGILLGPIIGPVLGGVITENLDWRWIFYINLPIGLFCLAMVYRYLHLPEEDDSSTIDWGVVTMMAVGVASLQFFLDMGNEKDWLESRAIQVSLALAVSGMVGWCYRSFKTRSEVAPLWIAKDRNLLVSSVMMAVVSVLLFGLVSQQPMMLEALLHYPAATTGILMAPRGIAAAGILLVIIKLNPPLGPRMMIVLGLCCCAFGTYLMMSYSLNIDIYWNVIPSIIQGAGLGLVFGALSSVAYITVDKKDAVAAASIFNLFRTIGSAIGISIVTTYQFRSSQEAWNQLGQGITPYSDNLRHWGQVTGLGSHSQQALTILQGQLAEQSQMVAFVHVFGFIFCGFLLAIPLVLFFRLPRKTN